MNTEATIPGATPPEPALSPEEIARQTMTAAFSDPSAFEILHALAKTLSPRWRQWYVVTARPSPTDRPHAALALGSLNTELFLTALARDPQQASNLLQDIESLERTLGVLEKVRTRHARLKALADGGEWDAVRRETEALGVEQASSLVDQRDPDLGVLVPVGSWFRALHLDAAVIAAEQESAATPNALNPDLLAWTTAQLARVGSATQGDKAVGLCQRTVDALSRWSTGAVTPRRRTGASESLGNLISFFHTP